VRCSAKLKHRVDKIALANEGDSVHIQVLKAPTFIHHKIYTKKHNLTFFCKEEQRPLNKMFQLLTQATLKMIFRRAKNRLI